MIGMVASIKIVTEYPLWLSVFCVLLGVVYAWFLYRKETRFNDAPTWVKRMMAGARFLLISILAFLLLSPFIKTLFNKVEKPVIIVAQDNSTSVLLNKDSSFYSNEYLSALTNLKENLSEDFDVRTFSFGEDFNEGLNIDYSDQLTDLSLAFDEINTKFYSRNVGAVILASDGIFNRGSNPVYTTKTQFPVYTIAMGDTALQKDIVLNEVVHNKITFLGNQFPLEIAASAFQCAGKSTKLKVLHKGQVVYEKLFSMNAAAQNLTDNILLEAKEVGVQYYRVEMSAIDGELSKLNNVKDVYIEVLDGRQNVLLLAEAPHPDLKALKLSIEKNENYATTTTFIQDFDGNVEPYSLVIACQPSKASLVKLQKVLEGDISVLFVLGDNMDISQFNRLGTGLKVTQSRNKSNQMLADVNVNFPLFSLSEKTIKAIKDMPPLVGPFGNYNVNSNGYVLCYQRIGSVTTEAPLILFFQEQNKKVGIISGEGIWRWRLHDFMANENQDAFDELMNKCVQFLAVKEDKSKFRVFSENNYFENQEVQFRAELYNQSYELVNDPEINLSVKDGDGKEYKFLFNRTMQSYVLNAGRFPAGQYVYTATVKWGEKSYNAQGKFTVRKLQLESNRTRADHQLMQNMASKFGGKMFSPYQLNELAQEIKSNGNIAAVIYEEKELKEIVHLKWIFFVLLALLSFEWFARKRNGAY